MDHGVYSPEYFSKLVEAHRSKKDTEKHEVGEKIKIHLFKKLEEACREGKTRIDISCKEMRKQVADKWYEKTFLDLLQNEISAYFTGKGFSVEFYKSHYYDCDCYGQRDGCTCFIRFGFEMTPR